MNQARFYEVPDKVVHDHILLHLMTITKPKRLGKRLENVDRRKDRKVTVKFSLLTESHPDIVPVCKATFTSVLGISKERVSQLAHYDSENATARPERRGGTHCRRIPSKQCFDADN